MKKFAILFLCAFFVCTLSAGEAEIKKTLNNINDAFRFSDMEQMLPYFSTGYVEITPDGKTLTFAQIADSARVYKLLRTDNCKFSDIMILYARYNGQELSQDQINQLKAHDNTDEGKNFIKYMKSSLEKHRERTAQIADSFKIVSVKVDGNKAVAVYTCTDTKTNGIVEHTVDLIKSDGKWLVSKSVIKKR